MIGSSFRNTDVHHRDQSNPHPRGSSRGSPRGSGGHRPHHATSDHNDRRSIVRSDDENNNHDDLPMVSSDANQMDLYSDERRLIERIEIEKKFSWKSLRLKDQWQTVYDRNPHLREVFMNGRWIEKYDKDFTKENRILTSVSNENSNHNIKKYSTTEHWGQRKLFLTEMEFLTKYASEEKYIVVYAGAAPGTHLNYLASLFPQLDFVLYDEKDLLAKSINNVRSRSEKFTADIARSYSDSSRKVLFICNVRTYRAQADGQNDPKEDMENQLEWYGLMKPQVALLNFRLPRQSGKFSYFKGHQIIEPWTSKRPTECRLVVKKDPKMIDYDYQDFEDDLNRFQNNTRVMYYKHSMDDVENEGLDHCYDCRAEIFILQEYLTKIQHVRGDNNLKTAIATMSKQISVQIHDKTRPRFLSVPRTLAVIPKRTKSFSTNV